MAIIVYVGVTREDATRIPAAISVLREGLSHTSRSHDRELATRLNQMAGPREPEPEPEPDEATARSESEPGS
jgi:hypothetical protein